MINRRLGYIILLFLTATFVWLCVHVLNGIMYPDHLRVVAFPKAGNLLIEDPVKMHGVDVGYVDNVQSVANNALITLHFFEKITIHSNYKIETVDKGILGQRIIVIDPGTADFPQTTPADTLRGHFQPGISELVGQAWKLKHKIGEFIHLSDRLLHGTDSSSSLVRRFETIVVETDNVTREIAEITESLHGSLNGQIQLLSSVLQSTESMITTASVLAPEYIQTVETQIAKIFSALSSLQTLCSDLQVVIDTLQDEEGLLMGDKVATLQQMLRKIRALTKQVRENGYNLKTLFTL